ncbi:hypothetical protein EC991_007477 [Linnemannia zychae]|nr:hypothetical protein EC991_007477 [Linnemannia zychae]
MNTSINANFSVDITDQFNDVWKNWSKGFIDDAAFTEGVLKHLMAYFGHTYNIAIIHSPHVIDGERIHRHHEKPNGSFTTKGYDVYLMPRGRRAVLTNLGDGGFINWRFSGDFNRDGQTVTFV